MRSVVRGRGCYEGVPCDAGGLSSGRARLCWAWGGARSRVLASCHRTLSIAYVCTHVDRSGRRNSGRYMAPAQPGLRFAASYRGRECVVRAPGPRGTAPAGPPRAEREDDEDRDPRSDDEIFVVPRKIRYALRARRRNVARRAFLSLLYLIIPVRRAFIAFMRCLSISFDVRSDPCTCTVERSTPTTT